MSPDFLVNNVFDLQKPQKVFWGTVFIKYIRYHIQFLNNKRTYRRLSQGFWSDILHYSLMFEWICQQELLMFLLTGFQKIDSHFSFILGAKTSHVGIGREGIRYKDNELVLR